MTLSLTNKDAGHLQQQARTPIGSFQGQFAKVPAVALGVAAVGAALKQAGLTPDHVEDVYFGNAIQAGVGQSPARQVALGSGCKDTTEATTINKVSFSLPPLPIFLSLGNGVKARLFFGILMKDLERFRFALQE